MKKTYYYYGLVALAIITVSPTIIFAEVNTSSTSTKDRLRAVVNNVEQKYENKLQNVKVNKDIRNNTIASTTQEKREIRTEMRKDIYIIERNRIVNQLNLSVNNLKQIRIRIEARIEKATQAGRDMGKAKSLLVIADNKITLAKQAIDSLKSLEATSTVSTNAASTIIKLEKPRQMGVGAIKAVNDARKALNDVVVAIAHGMGLKLGITATSTNSKIPPQQTSQSTSTTE